MNKQSKMSPEMISGIDQILAEVKEPETGRSVSDLGLIERITYSKNYNRIIVKTLICTPRQSCMICGLITETIGNTIRRNLEEEFIKTFPCIHITSE